jgi:hypothetical protein
LIFINSWIRETLAYGANFALALPMPFCVPSTASQAKMLRALYRNLNQPIVFIKFF